MADLQPAALQHAHKAPHLRRDAKLAVLTWDADVDGFRTASLHSLEADTRRARGRRCFPRGPRAVCDPQARNPVPPSPLPSPQGGVDCGGVPLHQADRALGLCSCLRGRAGR